MAPLRVPDDGLLLIGEPGDTPSFPSQAFAVTLDDDVIEDLIRCFQNDEEIQLSLGSSPALLYGQSTHTLSRTGDDIEQDFYLTQPFSESIKRARKVPNTMPAFRLPKGYSRSKPPHIHINGESKRAASPAKDQAAMGKSSGSTGLDSDLEALQNSMARAEAQKSQTLVVDEITSTKPGGKRKGKFLASVPRGSSAPRSMPSSPALNASNGSPSMGPVSATQLARERNKEQRVILIHELAAQDRSQEYLEKKWTGKQNEFMSTLKKIADCNAATGKWTLTGKTYWRELDVWSYEYETQELRQQAIDNAVRQYDKSRLSTGSAEWDLLLPKEERGKGKCLSRLQANLSKQSAAAAPAAQAPKTKANKVEGATDSSREDSDAKATSMSRSSSNPLPARKTGDAKKLAPKKTSTPMRASPAKTKTNQVKATEKRVLSTEFVQDSDSDSSDQALITKAKPPPKTKPPPPAPVAAPAPRVRQTEVSSPKIGKMSKAKVGAKPPAKPMAATTNTAKRSRDYDDDDDDDDDGDSSSSDGPLSKRLKSKPAPKPTIGSRRDKGPAPVPVLKHRPSDASQNSRGTTASSGGYSAGKGSGVGGNKNNTSPAKSSPLASSPPTNASDLSQEETPEPPALQTPPKKRPAPERDDVGGRRDRVGGRDRDRRAPEKEAKRQKREERSLPASLVDKAHRFKEYYEQYQTLHYELEAMDHPPRDKIRELVRLRDSLAKMKSEIQSECHRRYEENHL